MYNSTIYIYLYISLYSTGNWSCERCDLPIPCLLKNYKKKTKKER